MKSYIKIYGPPVYEAIKELERISIDFEEVCIMDTIIGQADWYNEISGGLEDTQEYFHTIAPISTERCSNIISKSGEALGEYDFFFEWFKDPNDTQINELIKRIDKALTKLGCRYTITTK
jgi:hypothetical protein